MSDVGKNIRSPIIFRRVQFTLDIYRQHTPTPRNAACPSRIGHVPEATYRQEKKLNSGQMMPETEKGKVGIKGIS